MRPPSPGQCPGSNDHHLSPAILGPGCCSAPTGPRSTPTPEPRAHPGMLSPLPATSPPTPGPLPARPMCHPLASWPLPLATGVAGSSPCCTSGVASTFGGPQWWVVASMTRHPCWPLQPLPCLQMLGLKSQETEDFCDSLQYFQDKMFCTKGLCTAWSQIGVWPCTGAQGPQ